MPDHLKKDLKITTLTNDLQFFVNKTSKWLKVSLAFMEMTQMGRVLMIFPSRVRGLQNLQFQKNILDNLTFAGLWENSFRLPAAI